MNSDRVRKEKYLSKLLRHDSEGISMNTEGWVDVGPILKKLNILFSELKNIVDNSSKNRFSLNLEYFQPGATKIKANQGHTIKNLDLKFDEVIPPDILYHGSPTKFKDKIWKEGLKKMQRHHVHLSTDIEVAKKVGARRGNPYIFQIDTKKMYEDGIKFYVSENNVYLTEYVSPKYLSEL